MKAETFISPDVTEDMAHEYVTSVSTSLQKHLAGIPKSQWQGCARIELQAFIEKTLRPNLAHYKTTQPNDVEDFLAVGVSIVLRRAYEIAKAEAGADSIWEVYDSLSMENMVKVILVAVLADFMLEMAHPHMQHTQQSARDIHANAGQFLHP